MQWQQIGDEDVTTPRRHHVSVEERGQGTPEHGAILDSLDPEEEGEDEQEDGNGLVVVATGHGSRDVAWCDAHEGGGEETRRGRIDHLIREEIGCERCEARESGSEEDANVTDVYGHGEGAEEVVDGAAGDHETWVEGTTGDSTEGMPCS